MLEVRSPDNADEWRAYYALRYRVLRQPLGRPPGSERDALEEHSTHRMICDPTGKVLAVGRMHDAGDQTAQIRYMAVAVAQQRRGCGSRMLQALEQKAATLGASRIVLDAREAALGFYARQGYSAEGPGHMLYNSISHIRMRKTL